MDFSELNDTAANMDAGVWMWWDAAPADEEAAKSAARIKLRHPLSDEYQKVRRKEEAIFRKRNAIGPRELTEEESMEVGRRAMSKALILEWVNFADKGEPVPHSEAEAYSRLGNVLFMRKVLTLAAVEESYYRENLEVLAGN